MSRKQVEQLQTPHSFHSESVFMLATDQQKAYSNQNQNLINQISLLTNHSRMSAKSRSTHIGDKDQLQFPITSAISWGIHDLDTGDLLWGKQTTEVREMASLTKMMTLYACLEGADRFQIPLDSVVTVPRFAAYTAGTIAYLREGDQILLEDLLYALMLPSGNDAANVIANFIGNQILQSPTRKSRTKIQNQQITAQDNLKKFVDFMNQLAYQLGLKNTCFSNAHGLSDKSNKSSASDLGRLASISIKQFPLIRKVVSTQRYVCTVKQSNSQKTRCMIWSNTNILLNKEGFEGIKTGWTPNAGACLSILYSLNNINIIITILNSKSNEKKFLEAETLAIWARNKLSRVQKTIQNSRVSIRTRILSVNPNSNNSSIKNRRQNSLKQKMFGDLNNLSNSQ